MYTASHYKMSDEAIQELLETPKIGGDLITQSEAGVTATYTPFRYDPDMSERGSLVGHLNWLNDAWKDSAKEVLVILHGPEAYLQSEWLHEPDEAQVVAITNYVAVHVRGEMIVHTEPDWVEREMHKLSAMFEPTYELFDVPERLLQGMLKAMVAIEIKIKEVEGHARMSQNRSPERIRKIIAGLRSVDNEPAASWMERHSLPYALEKERLVNEAVARKRAKQQ
ncbi:MAG: FMN-binding negative transcriptional regulator [Propionibacteriaceae bacterium]|jgi:transcriptional regulator|nr:FMN-binding negative transcriptional regulator [Propionibacteriaceae bacterium]